MLEWSFAQLTLESFPEEGSHSFSIINKFLAVKPASQTLNVNEFHGTCTFAWAY